MLYITIKYKSLQIPVKKSDNCLWNIMKEKVLKYRKTGQTILHIFESILKAWFQLKWNSKLNVSIHSSLWWHPTL